MHAPPPHISSWYISAHHYLLRQANVRTESKSMLNDFKAPGKGKSSSVCTSSPAQPLQTCENSFSKVCHLWPPALGPWAGALASVALWVGWRVLERSPVPCSQRQPGILTLKSWLVAEWDVDNNSNNMGKTKNSFVVVVHLFEAGLCLTGCISEISRRKPQS